MSVRLEDYAMIGDCQTAALVSRYGSIDWLCLPSFDSAAVFTSLLGSKDNGCWKLEPLSKERRRTWRYRPKTLILETGIETEDGIILVCDFMPVRQERPDLVRIIMGKAGAVTMRTEVAFRFDYGSMTPWVRQNGDGITAVAGPDMVHLASTVPFTSDNTASHSTFVVRAGETVSFDLAWYPSHLKIGSTLEPLEALESTETWWTDWLSKRVNVKERWREAVERSLITLKALTFLPTGGIVAAPTTSIPEQLGGDRNWDYRFSWLRDSTLTLYALSLCGHIREAEAWRDWLLRTVAGEPDDVQIMYGLRGERRLEERELPWLDGYELSKPVRTGNAAYDQLQLDVFGEVLDTFYQSVHSGLTLTDFDWPLIRALLLHVQKVWNQPDEGIWEVRGPRRHFTHSKIMCWVALDRGIRIMEEKKLDGPLEELKTLRRTIHEQVCAEGFNHTLNSFTQFYGSDLVDASLLLIPELGFLPIDDPRVKGTIDLIESRLKEDCFVHRYEHQPEVDGLKVGEASFLPCSFWYVDCLSIEGRFEEAESAFDNLLAIRSDLGLLAEEYDLKQRRMVGSFPQAFSHVGLINSAVNLSRSAEGVARKRRQ